MTGQNHRHHYRGFPVGFFLFWLFFMMFFGWKLFFIFPFLTLFFFFWVPWGLMEAEVEMEKPKRKPKNDDWYADEYV